MSEVVVEADTLAAATELLNADPFVAEGIFATVDIKPCRLAYDHMSPEV